MRPVGGWAPLLFAFCACSKSDPAPTPWTSTRKPLAERIPGVPGLENLARMHAGLYRGAQPEAEGFQQLKARGIKTVINLRAWHSEDEEVRNQGMTPVRIKLQADVRGSEPPTEEQIRLFFEIVLDPARQPVYFHCALGKDRTGMMAALYRIEVDGWTPEEAIEEMQAFGYNDLWRDLIDFVKRYKPRGYKR